MSIQTSVQNRILYILADVMNEDIAKDVLVSLDPYTSGDRYYHDLEHVAEMLEYVTRRSGFLAMTREIKLALFLAICWHDVVYNTKAAKGENELMSIGYAMNECRSLGIEPSMRLIEQLIKLSIDHDAMGRTYVEQLFVDADLIRFSAPWEEFVKHNEHIRAEYPWVSEKDWLAGRAGVLEKYLYRVPFYYQEHPATAAQGKLNLVQAISELRHAND